MSLSPAQEVLCDPLEKGLPSAAALIRQQAREIDDLWDRLSRAWFCRLDLEMRVRRREIISAYSSGDLLPTPIFLGLTLHCRRLRILWAGMSDWLGYLRSGRLAKRGSKKGMGEAPASTSP
jgi:hypothetical protein